MTQQSNIRVSPPELAIPEGNPFESDQLKRKPSCELLTKLVSRIEGTCTIAIDGAWGSGKTTFLNLWAALLKDKNDAFSVIQVNAWKTDYFNDPFLAIVGEMTKQLMDMEEFEKTDLSNLKKSFAVVASITSRYVLHQIGLTSEDVADLAGLIKSNASKRMDQYKEQSESMESFRTELKKVARKVREQTQKPLIVLIDELDRCKPSYAVEFLEIIKHLMSVDNIVYTFATNRSELAHAISGCYGSDYDSKGYLRRFFDIDFTLPLSSRQTFINSIYDEQLGSIITDPNAKDESICLLRAFLDNEKISLRQIQQALYRLRLVLHIALPDNNEPPNRIVKVVEYCTALFLRLYDPEMLRKFLNGELSDKEVVESLLPPKIKNDDNLREERLWFEITVIRAAQEIMGKNPSTRDYEPTPLLLWYTNLVDSAPASSEVISEKLFAKNLISKVQILAGKDPRYGHARVTPHRFKLAVEQLEILESLTNSRERN